MKNKLSYLVSLVLLAALIFNPFEANVFELPKVAFLALALAAILLSFCLYSLQKGELNVRWHKFVYLFLGLWILSLIVSTVFSVAPNLSFWGDYYRLQGLYSQLIYVGFFLVFLNFLKEKNAQNIFLKTLIVISSLISIYAIFQKFGFDIYPAQTIIKNEFLGRSFATLGHPNFLGQFLLFPIFACIRFLTNSRKRLLYALSLILLITALIFTQNRASILALCVGLIIFVFIEIKTKPLYKYLFSGALILAAAGYLYFFADTLRSLFTRFYLWQGALGVFPDHPLIGYGLETFKQVYQKVSAPEIFSLEHIAFIADRAHNTYLDILVTQGAFGFAIYSAIILILLYLSRRRPVFLCALIAILISNFFGFPMAIHNLLFVALAALILNSGLKFKEISITKNILILPLSILFAIFSALLIYNSITAVYADLQVKKGLDLARIGNYSEGVSTLETAVKFNPHQDEISFRLADILTLLGKEFNEPTLLREADQFIQKGGKFSNYDFQYYFLNGKIKAYLKDNAVAKASLQKARELAPNNPILIQESDVILREMGL